MRFQKLLSIFVTGLICFICVPFTTTFAEETEIIDIWDGTADTSWIDLDWKFSDFAPPGGGEVKRELHITTPEQFAGMIKVIVEGPTKTQYPFYGTIIYLDNDIYLNDTSDWQKWDIEAPANVWESANRINGNIFSGTFDGQGHTIYGLYGDTLFGEVGSGTIKNVITDEGLVISGDNMYIGVIAVEAANIINCKNFCSINVTSRDVDIGGIVGKCTESIQNCCNYGNITLHSTSFKLSNAGVIENYSMGTVSGICGNAGGLDGQPIKPEIKNCYNRGKLCISSDSADYYYLSLLGICGSNARGTIVNCYNSGELISSGIKSRKYAISYDSAEANNCYQIDNPSESQSMVGLLGDAFVYVEGDYPKLAWEVSETIILGDINGDTEFNISDIVMLQNWLVGTGELTNWKAGDLFEDNIINTFDLCLMKRKLIEII